jgi:hypothetical protein
VAPDAHALDEVRKLGLATDDGRRAMLTPAGA